MIIGKENARRIIAALRYYAHDRAKQDYRDPDDYEEWKLAEQLEKSLKRSEASLRSREPA